jgi:hypothetical protein
LLYPAAARFNEKGCLPVWGWRCSKAGDENEIKLPQPKQDFRFLKSDNYMSVIALNLI